MTRRIKMTTKLVDTVPLKQGQRAYPVVDGKVQWDQPIALYAAAWPVVDFSPIKQALTVREMGYLTLQEPREFVVLGEDLPDETVLYR
jgi:hypothetical protein